MNCDIKKIEKNNNIDDVDQLIEECDKLNRQEESEISFDLGQFNEYLINNQSEQFCQLNQTHSTSQEIITQTNPDFNCNQNHNQTNNIHIQHDQQQKSVYYLTDSQIINQISKQIGYFDGSIIDNNEQRYSNNCNFSDNLNNISDNYVEYIEKLLRNINIQEMQENEKSLEQAIQLANQNMNIDLNQQSVMLNSILQEINNMNINNNNNNNIDNHDSNDIVVINQTSNESNKAELKFKKIQMENNPSITPFNQQNQQEQVQNKENINQIVNNQPKNRICNIFQMNFIYI